MDAKEYQIWFNYLTFGFPPVETISIACEFCKSKELVIQQRWKKVLKNPDYDEILGKFVFFCPYCYHIEEVEIKSICLTDVTMKDIVESLKKQDDIEIPVAKVE